jgi:predicted 2-oxoglutarate/Fe(II)-dependent dioxygenase YbiX
VPGGGPAGAVQGAKASNQLDQSIIKTRAELGDTHQAVLGLTAVYHNLLRRWAEV